MIKFQLLVTRFFRVLRQLRREIPPDWWWKKLVKYQVLQKMVVICYVPPKFARFRKQSSNQLCSKTTTGWGWSPIRHVDQNSPVTLELTKKHAKNFKVPFFWSWKDPHRIFVMWCRHKLQFKTLTNPSLLPAITMSTMSDLRWTMQLFISKK